MNGERLGAIMLPDPESHHASLNGRTAKQALEILILADALGMSDLGIVSIDDANGTSERTDFHVKTSHRGELDFEVTQLRDERSAAQQSSVGELQAALRSALSADSALSYER